MSDHHITAAASLTDGAVTPAVGMDAALKLKWVEALRSGKYEQARGFLEHGGGNCCLGVLCRVADIRIDENRCLDGHGKDIGYEPIYGLGIDELQAFVLWSMNDGADAHKNNPRSFSEIADYIEQHIPTRDEPAR